MMQQHDGIATVAAASVVATTPFSWQHNLLVIPSCSEQLSSLKLQPAVSGSAVLPDRFKKKRKKCTTFSDSLSLDTPDHAPSRHRGSDVLATTSTWIFLGLKRVAIEQLASVELVAAKEQHISCACSSSSGERCHHNSA
jgi:hypothetical protein